VIDRLASNLGAAPLYPFAGPPWLPFQRWAQKADRVFVSPLGILIHPEFGLWHSYRGALTFREHLDLPAAATEASPCDSCREKPCLTRCPVSAFSGAGYDVAGCRAHISTRAGTACMDGGCLARRACPVGAAHRYAPAQASFHMQAFLRSSYLPDP
jgi:epoxyqueuosine reductase QueG